MNLFKTQEQLITEIHNAFDTAQDRLLSEANEILSKAKIDEQPIERLSERLKAVGFVQTPVSKEAEKIKEERKGIVKTRDEAELIEYYKRTYPFLKFLTELELEKICDKYKLIFAPVNNYKENVPEKNLRDIERAQMIQDLDKPESRTYFSGEVWCSYDYVELKKLLKDKCANLKKVLFKEIKEQRGTYISDESRIAMGVLNSLGIPFGDSRHIWINGQIETVKMDGLFIAAPASHFNLDGLTQKGKHGFLNVFVTEVKDPIVFRYVRGGVQVITKWGLEANDPALVVPVLN